MGKAVKRLEITYYDKDTGEILASVDPEELVKKLEWKDKRKRAKVMNRFYGGKVMIFQNILKRAVKELTEGELRVFNYMLGVMDFENWISVPQKQMAKEIRVISPSNGTKPMLAFINAFALSPPPDIIFFLLDTKF